MNFRERGLRFLSIAMASPMVPENDIPMIFSFFKMGTNVLQPSHTELHNSSRLCSTYPGCEKYVRRCVEVDRSILPLRSMRTILELVVPQSAASKHSR